MKKNADQPRIVCEIRSIPSSGSSHGQHTSKLHSSLCVLFQWWDHSAAVASWSAQQLIGKVFLQSLWKLIWTSESKTVMIGYDQLSDQFQRTRKDSGLDSHMWSEQVCKILPGSGCKLQTVPFALEMHLLRTPRTWGLRQGLQAFRPIPTVSEQWLDRRILPGRFHSS